jgi:alpha-beta hydrolase superfamily lysophospholipase
MDSCKVLNSLTKPSSIVAVHGLGGHWKKTWTSDDDSFWLRDFLPQLLTAAGIAARVMSFGYNSATAFSKAKTSIRTHAVILLNLLREVRQTEEQKSRNILFIAHSLGGIVVKQVKLIPLTSTED